MNPRNPRAEAPSYVRETRSLLSAGPFGWLTTLDHKRLGVLYLVASGLALLAAAVLSVALHQDLAASTIFGFLFLAPAIPATLGTFFLPLQLGQKSAALPRVSLAGFWLYILGAGAVFAGLAATGGGKPAEAGLAPMIAGALAIGASMTLAAVNVLATTGRAFVRGAPSSRLTLFAWSLIATSIAVILGFLALGGLLGLVVVARASVPGLSVGLFPQDVVARILARPWTDLAPVGALALVPAVGIASDVFAAFAGRKRAAGYAVVATSLVVLAWLGFVEWVFPLFGAGVSPLQLGFETSAIAAAFGIIVLSWVATLHRGRITIATPLLWALGCLFQLTVGVPAALLLGVPPSGSDLHGTLFEVGFRHGILAGGAAMGFAAGLTYFWPKITGKLYDERVARPAFALVFVGAQVAFLAEMIEGVRPEWTALEAVSTYGTWALVLGGVATFAALAASLRSGAEAAGANPWAAASGLEWTVASPPPRDNFEEEPDGEPEPSGVEGSPRAA